MSIAPPPRATRPPGGRPPAPPALGAGAPRPGAQGSPAHHAQVPAARRPGAAAPAGARRRAGSAALAAGLAMPLADLAALAALAAAGAAAGAGWLVAGYAALVYLALAGLGLHRLRICLRVADQAGRITVAAALPALAVAPWMPPGRLLWLVAGTTLALLAARAAVCAALRAAHRRGRLTGRAVLVGTGPAAGQLSTLLREHPELGLRPQGPVSPAELPAVVAGRGISRVIVCPADGGDRELGVVLRDGPGRVDTCLVPPVASPGLAVPAGCLDDIWGVPLIPLRGGRGRAARAAKRAFDLAAAALLLIVTAPLIAVAAAAVALRLPRPVLFRQVRVTGPGKQAEIVKLRTLGQHGDPDTTWSAPPAQCGRLGAVLRRTHLDELPQLASVLRGDMSLVGPRPERPHFARRFSQAIPGYAGRQRMPAGMTGWAQVHGLNGDTSITDRARFDNYYIDYWSAWLDLVILARTVTSIPAGLAGARGGRP